MLRGLMLRRVKIFWARANIHFHMTAVDCKVTTKKVTRKSRQNIEGEDDDTTTTKKRSPEN